MAKVEAKTHGSFFRNSPFSGLLPRLWCELPRRGTLPDEVWQSRHRFLLAILWFHTVSIGAIGPVLGYRWAGNLAPLFGYQTAVPLIFWALPMAVCAAVGTWGSKRRMVQASAVSLGLLTSSAVLVHLLGGYPEIHIHFFLMVALMALYQDWAPYLLAILFVAVHEGIFGILWRGAVYHRPEVLDAPWTWAGIHAFAILCTATASVIAWRFNEKASEQLKLILNSVGEGLIGLDRDGKVTFVNPAASDLLGWDPQKIVGSPLAPVLGHRRNDGTVLTEITSPIFTSLRDGTRQSGSDHLFSNSDGTDVPVDFLCTPAVEGSYVTGAVVSFRDVTARQKAEERLRQTKELQPLHEINRTILESRDICLMMEGILDKVFAFGGYDIGMICLASSDRKSLEPVAHRGFRDSERWDRNSARRELWPRDGIVDRVLTTRQIRSVDLSKGDRIRTFREEGTQQLVIVPLRTDSEGLGVFYLGTRSAREFRANEIDLLDAIGLQVGIAIQKATLFEQADKKSRELETLARINRSLASRLNDETLLPRIVEEAKKTLQADGAYVRLIEADSLVLVSGSTPESHYTRERIGLNESLSGKIVRENRVLAISNILADPTLIEEHRQLCLRIGYQSFLGIPLRVGDQVIGAVNCLSKRKREFRPDEIELMTAFADQAAIAIHNARLYGQSEQSKKELESANRRLEKLLEDQSSLYADLTPLAQAESTPQLLEKVIDRLMEATGADAASIRFLDRATQTFYVPAQRGFPSRYLEAPRTKIAGTATAEVFDTGEPIIAPDIETDHRIVRKLQMEVGLRSCAFLPLKVRGEVRGIVQLASRQTGYFHAARESFLMAIVRQMGIALENRELFEEVNAAKSELQRSNQDLEQFAYVASHDLQEPLRMVSGYTQLLAKRYKGRLDPEADEFIGFAVSGANRMQALIQGLLEFSRVGSKKGNAAPTDCGVTLQMALAGLRVPIGECGAEISYDPLPQVLVHETHLVQLFQNLIGNGIKYQIKGSPKIHVSCKLDGDRWKFSVKDNGIGIEPQYAERIFVIFQRLHTQQEYPGAGIGLALCKKIVERYGGKIWLESEPGKGSEFFFTLPALTMN